MTYSSDLTDKEWEILEPGSPLLFDLQKQAGDPPVDSQETLDQEFLPETITNVRQLWQDANSIKAHEGLRPPTPLSFCGERLKRI